MAGRSARTSAASVGSATCSPVHRAVALTWSLSWGRRGQSDQSTAAKEPPCPSRREISPFSSAFWRCFARNHRIQAACSPSIQSWSAIRALFSRRLACFSRVSLACVKRVTQKLSNLRLQDNQIRVNKAIDSVIINCTIVMGKQIPKINYQPRIGN
jgi:hypothetical protein